MKKNTYIVLLIIQSVIFGVSVNSDMLSNEPYIMGEDGVVRMNINIIGHVKNPGTFIVYDGVDILTALSLAGGYLQGANLKKILIRHFDGTSDLINLDEFMSKNTSKNSESKLRPRDTIYIEQKLGSKLITSSKLPGIILSILNIALTLERTD